MVSSPSITTAGGTMPRNTRLGLLFAFVVSAVLWLSIGYGIATLV